MVHFYRNVFSVVPRSKDKLEAAMLKTINSQEDKTAVIEKMQVVIDKLKEMKLFEAVRKVKQKDRETLVYMDFPREHWRRIRSNNAMEPLNRESRRRTRAVGAFLDGHSALMLLCARLKYMQDSLWGQKTYYFMQHLEDNLLSVS